jgi:hypothetical protein
VTNDLRPPEEYDVRARRISGSHADKLEQIDEAIQEWLDIKAIECLSDRPDVGFLAVPRRSHWFAMTVTILVLLVLLVLLLGVRPTRAQGASRWPAHSSAKR